MIDTDKYEGHAEGEWTIEQSDTVYEFAINAQDYGTIAQTFYRDSDKLFYATSRLIADAPLLLAEVKRLRDELKFVVEMLEGKPSNMEWYECRNLILEQVVIDLDD